MANIFFVAKNYGLLPVNVHSWLPSMKSAQTKVWAALPAMIASMSVYLTTNCTTASNKNRTKNRNFSWNMFHCPSLSIDIFPYSHHVGVMCVSDFFSRTFPDTFILMALSDHRFYLEIVNHPCCYAPLCRTAPLANHMVKCAIKETMKLLDSPKLFCQ